MPLCGSRIFNGLSDQLADDYGMLMESLMFQWKVKSFWRRNLSRFGFGKRKKNRKCCSHHSTESDFQLIPATCIKQFRALIRNYVENVLMLHGCYTFFPFAPCSFATTLVTSLHTTAENNFTGMCFIFNFAVFHLTRFSIYFCLLLCKYTFNCWGFFRLLRGNENHFCRLLPREINGVEYRPESAFRLYFNQCLMHKQLAPTTFWPREKI